MTREKMYDDLHVDETELKGEWVPIGTRMAKDSTSERIEWLTTSRLDRIATTSDGWSTLYRDPRDGRLWEKTYPKSELQGGGPPALQCISALEAQSRYVCHLAEVSVRRT